MNAPASISPARRAAFTVAMLALPVLFFLLLEGGLRLFGYGADTRLFVEHELHGRAYYAINPGVVKRYFGQEGFVTYTSRDLFARGKPPGTYRIFALGASTTVGFPYMFNAAYPTLLRTRLEALFPEKHFEVVNVGLTAVNSFTVADLTKEVVRYDPDLLIVYTGHNEFYGALGVASTEGAGRNYHVIRFRMWLRHLKTAELLRNTIARTMRRTDPPIDETGETLMERMAREQQIARGSDLYRLALRHYERNLTSVATTARDHGVPLVLSTVVSNLKDQPPFVSLHGVGEGTAEFDGWRRQYEAGVSALDAGDTDAAISSFEEAALVDPMHAGTQFHLGRALETAGNAEAARVAYERARDLDGLRFRASGDFNDAVRAVARAFDLPLVEMERVFQGASEHGIPGRDLFWEHVHPTYDGYFLMAGAFEKIMADHGLGAQIAEWQAAEGIDDAQLHERAGVTDFDREVGRVRVDYLMRRWPFRAVPERFEYLPENRLQELVWTYLQGRTSWRLAVLELAGLYESEEDWASAEQMYQALSVAFPQEPYYADATGNMQARQRKTVRAAESYRRALRYDETADLRAKLGYAYFDLGRLQEAADHLDRASELAALRGELPPRQRAQVDLILAQTWLRLGHREGAERQLEKLQGYAAEAPFTRALERELARHTTEN